MNQFFLTNQLSEQPHKFIHKPHLTRMPVKIILHGTLEVIKRIDFGWRFIHGREASSVMLQTQKHAAHIASRIIVFYK